MSVEIGPVEYAVTADGVSIAYQALGRGPVVLHVPTVSVPLRVEEELIERVSWRNALRQFASVVSWDQRGLGMSGRSVKDFSIDAWVADASAVAEALGPPVPVFASAFSGPIAIELAARRPDLVSQLILVDSGVSGADLIRHRHHQAVLALLDVDWALTREFLTRVTLRIEEPLASAVVDTWGAETDEDVVREVFKAIHDFDASSAAAQLSVPTLIVERQDHAAHDDFAATNRNLSRLIAAARLIRTREDSTGFDQVAAFLFGEDAPDAHGAFRTVMFTDLVSSTALTQRLGDDAAQQVLEAHDQVVRAALDTHNGTEIKHTGDGIMAAFGSATDAARAARVLAQTLHNDGVGVRVGLNAGEPIERDGDLFGTAVQLAARVGDAADRGQVLATRVVRDLTAGKGLNWSAAPAVEAKGFDDPVAVFSLEPSD